MVSGFWLEEKFYSHYFRLRVASIIVVGAIAIVDDVLEHSLVFAVLVGAKFCHIMIYAR